MDLDAAAQFVVQVDKAVIILSGFHIDIFSNQFGDIFQRFLLASPLLDNNLMGNHVFPTIKEAVFPFFGDRQIVGNHVSLACQQFPNQFVNAVSYFDSEL